MKRPFQILMTLMVLSGSMLWTSSAYAQTTTVRPRPIEDVLYNPGVGVELWNRTTRGAPESYPEVKVTYYRWYWHQIEPERGRIRWDIIDAAFEDAASNGDRLGLRLMTVGGGNRGNYKGKEGLLAVPDWWAEKVGGFWYPAPRSRERTMTAADSVAWRERMAAMPDSVRERWQRRREERAARAAAGPDSVFWPDYNGAAFQVEIDRIMKAFGERYADHPGLNHLDTSFFGCWGEQNDACIEGHVKPEHMWSPETYRKAIDVQFEAFPNTPIMQLGKTDSTIYDYPMRVRKTGWRVDCFGDYGYFGPGWNHMESYYPQILERYGDAWEHGMVSFEICGTIQSWVDKKFDFDQIMDKALEWHATSMNLKAGNIPEEWMPKLLDTIKYMGYRLRVAEAELPAAVGAADAWTLRLEMVNEGVAPPYHIYPIALKLEGASGPAWVHKTDSVDVRTWLPGSHAVNLAVPPSDLPTGSYTLSVALLDRHEGMPGIQLANEGREGESFFYALGTVKVAR